LSEGEDQGQQKKTLKLTDLEGVGDATAKKLRDAGIESVEVLAVTPVRDLMEKVGLSEKTAFNLSKMAKKNCVAPG